MIYNAPVFFEKNRAYRVYLGGKMFDYLMGDGSVDCNLPEEWIASSVEALNEGRDVYKEGVSKIAGTDLYFDKALEMYKKEMLGDKENIGILTKYLDSAIRLPAQCHPDKAFSREHFNSQYGKEECWLVLATRPGGCVYFGFKDGVTREDLENAYDESETNVDAFEKILKKHDVVPGDVIFIPAKVPHAIGAGCLILEVQEPTDFTISPEYYCGDIKLSEYEKFLGLGRKLAMDCFSFEPVKQTKVPPILVFDENGVKLEHLITEEQTTSFAMNRITLTGGSFKLAQSAGVYCVVEGNGKITGSDYEREIKQGEYFFLPAEASGKYSITGDLTLIESYS